MIAQYAWLRCWCHGKTKMIFCFCFLHHNTKSLRMRYKGLLTALPATRNSFITWMLDMHFDYTIMYER
jgi:hypothetical protein